MEKSGFVIAMLAALAAFAEEALPMKAEATLRSALACMATRQWSGGWGMAWTKDGSVVWGEYRPMPQRCITVQPPATPGTARVYVRAARLLGDATYAQRARMARDALLKLQTPEGGFPHEGDPTAGPGRYGTFDDDVTTGALDLLIDWWQFTGHEEDRRAVERVGEFLLKVQYPDSGGWPQQWPALPYSYAHYITLNDDVMVNVMRALLKLHRLTSDDRYLEAAKKGGDCLIKLQGGAGEAVWAQQYDSKTLKPAWARKFEPAGYTAAESIGVCSMLVDLHLYTGLKRFLEPLPKAFVWYQASRLPNGKWARLYEPGTHRPVYGRRDKAEPVYEFENACSGYGWQGNWYPHDAKRAYDRIQEIGCDAYRGEREAAESPPRATDYEVQVRTVCARLSPVGWWLRKPGGAERSYLEEQGLSPDQEIVSSGTFCANANLLLDYLQCIRAETQANKAR